MWCEFKVGTGEDTILNRKTLVNDPFTLNKGFSVSVLIKLWQVFYHLSRKESEIDHHLLVYTVNRSHTYVVDVIQVGYRVWKMM